MFYHDRLNDDYEIHQRDYGYLKDDLEVLVVGAKVKRRSWYQTLISRIGDALISAGHSMKETDNEIQATTLSPLTR